MALPKAIKLKSDTLPEHPGVYLMHDEAEKIIYVGKASSLKKRVTSYFTKAHDEKTALLVSKIKKIDYIVTGSILEATFLEADLIKKYQPRYNIDLKDDKSFAYIVVTKNEFPKVFIVRGKELHESGESGYKAVVGPFLSNSLAQSLLKVVGRIFPFSNCIPPQKGKKPKRCFYRHLGRCPGVCTGEITKEAYASTIKNLILFFKGRKKRVQNNLKKEMRLLAKNEQFEEAARLRNQLYNLEHIQDSLLIQKDVLRTTHSFNRIEGYDISNIQGKSAAGSMVVFENGEPNKNEYRRFRIKTVPGANDIAMIQEVLRRRFTHLWKEPDLILIDGGTAQVNAAMSVLRSLEKSIPIVGMAKGPKRTKTDLVFGPMPLESRKHIEQEKPILIHLRDEAHRFALSYHKKLREKL